MITGRLDDRAVMRGLDQIVKRADQNWFRELAPEARKDQREHAQRQEGPSARWQPRDLETERKLKAKRRSRRRVLGRLPGAINVRVHPDAIEIQSRVTWSGVHQEGGTVNNGATIPARPFLWWSDDFLNLAEDAALLYVLRDWR